MIINSNRRRCFRCLVVMLVFYLTDSIVRSNEPARPNFLFIITDDQSWEHVGCYGDPAVRTPSIDRLAKQGTRFTNAYCAAPSCSPSRAAILTGQDIFRLEEGGVLTGFIRTKFEVFPLILQREGYIVGNTGKSYWPRTKNVEGAYDEPIGRPFNRRILSPPKGISRNDYAANFAMFLDQVPRSKPFFFWVGMGEPHLPHPVGLGEKTGIATDEIRIPAFYPDAPEIRNGLSDYLAEIEWADQMFGKIIQELEKRDLTDNTLIVFTSDNGMPFPRAKATLYEHGVHVPLVVRWDKHVAAHRLVSNPVSLIDIAPTILDLAGSKAPGSMTGKSLRSILTSELSGRVNFERQFVVSAIEKHTLARPGNLGYPRRALHAEDWTYIRNYEPQRFPAGHPETLIPGWGTYGDIDPSIIKTYFMNHKNQPEINPLFELGFGKVPAEELYDKRTDVDTCKDLANSPDHREKLEELRGKLEHYLQENRDPRIRGQSPWDKYLLDKPFPVSQPRNK